MAYLAPIIGAFSKYIFSFELAIDSDAGVDIPDFILFSNIESIICSCVIYFIMLFYNKLNISPLTEIQH